MKLTPNDAGRMVNWVMDGVKQPPAELEYRAEEEDGYQYLVLYDKKWRRWFNEDGKGRNSHRTMYITSFVNETTEETRRESHKKAVVKMSNQNGMVLRWFYQNEKQSGYDRHDLYYNLDAAYIGMLFLRTTLSRILSNLLDAGYIEIAKTKRNPTGTHIGQYGARCALYRITKLGKEEYKKARKK